jgi:hypothetical protein
MEDNRKGLSGIKEGEYLKEKINELKADYQPRTW